MLVFSFLALVAQLSSALPIRSRESHALAVASAAKESAAAVPAAVTPPARAEAAPAPAKAEEAAKENEVELVGVFDKATALGGDNVKTDVLFKQGATGSAFEFEFSDATANSVLVTENKKPAAAPKGFTALDPSSYVVKLDKNSASATLRKIDFVFDATNAALKDVDISTGKIGKLCTETGTFIIDEALGELEFEVEENELTLSVAGDINGEWGVFVPTAAVVAPPAAAAPPAAGKDAVEEVKADEDEVVGAFDKAVATPAGNVKTDILFTEGASGKLEVEVNATAANAITVKQNASPVSPPAGFLFVDPTTFIISTDSATSEATDVVKVDYIFSAAVLAAVDPTKGVIGKLVDGAFVTEGLGEFEFEAEENEWTLTVPNLNGEWAVLIPKTAVLNQGKGEAKRAKASKDMKTAKEASKAAKESMHKA